MDAYPQITRLTRPGLFIPMLINYNVKSQLKQADR